MKQIYESELVRLIQCSRCKRIFMITSYNRRLRDFTYRIETENHLCKYNNTSTFLNKSFN